MCQMHIYIYIFIYSFTYVYIYISHLYTVSARNQRHGSCRMPCHRHRLGLWPEASKTDSQIPCAHMGGWHRPRWPRPRRELWDLIGRPLSKPACLASPSSDAGWERSWDSDLKLPEPCLLATSAVYVVTLGSCSNPNIASMFLPSGIKWTAKPQLWG